MQKTKAEISKPVTIAFVGKYNKGGGILKNQGLRQKRVLKESSCAIQVEMPISPLLLLSVMPQSLSQALRMQIIHSPSHS